MIEELYQQCLYSILNSQKPGYGFICDLVDTFLSINSQLTGINNIAVIWEYKHIDGRIQEVDYFYPGNKLNLVGINRKRIFSSNKPITSVDYDKNNFVDSSFVWYSHFVFIPVNTFSSELEYINIRGALLLLGNIQDINLSSNQIYMLHKLLNMKRPNTYDSFSVKKFLDVCFNGNFGGNTIGTRFDKTIKALETLSGNDNKEKNGVRYATFWKLNMISEIKTDKLSKQHECCYDSECIPKASHEEIKAEDNHFINDIRKINVSTLMEGNTVLSMYNYNDVVRSFADPNFLNRAEMGEGRLTAIIIPIFISGSVNSLDICCIYIKNIIYTPFVSISLTNQLKNIIHQSLVDVNEKIQSEMVNKLMTTYFTLKEQTKFYKSVAQTMADFNSMKDCLIYMCGAADELLYVRDEDMNNPQSYKSKLSYIGRRRCYLPFEYAQDKQFLNFLSSLDLLDNKTESNACVYMKSDANSIVKSALCILIQDNHKKENSGIIILINKTHLTHNKNEIDYDVITMDNVIATYLSALYLHQFGLWNKAVSRKNYLLKKLRHEIPNCTRVIREKMEQIREEIVTREYSLPSLTVFMNTMELNRSRINMLASFFAAVDYDDKRFAEKLKKRDLVEILSDNMPLFQEQAESRGVDVVLNKIVDKCYVNISAFYPLAIINVINNAIRYCSRATNIIINLFEDRIEIADIGIPIETDELEMIFEDGFRGRCAKERDAEGIGYGLHLSKRVLKAHGSTISVTSDKLSDENYFLETGVAYYLRLLPAELRLRYLTRDSSPAERSIIDRLYEKINRLDYSTDTNSEFYNRKEMLIRKWMAHEEDDGGPSFVEMEEAWFMEPIAKVVFTIRFGTEMN